MIMADSRQYWLDDALRRVAAEQQRNPEVLSRDFGDPRFANRPMQPAPVPQESYAGWLGDVIGRVKNFRVPQGPQIPGARTPLNPSGTLGGGVNMLKDMLIATGEDFGAEGGHKDTPIPMGKLAAAGLFPLRGIGKVAKSLIGGADEAATVKVKPSTTPKVRKPQTELGSYYGKMADESGYTEFVTRSSPVKGHGPTKDEQIQGFYDYLDWKATDDPGVYMYIDEMGNRKESVDLHELYRDILDFSTGAVKEPNFRFADWKKQIPSNKKQIPSNLSNDPKLERWPDQIPQKGKGSLQDQPDFPINHPAKTEFGKHWGNMADESGYTDLIANYNPGNSPLHTPEKAKEAFYQMLDMDPHKRFVNHDSKSNYDIHTIFREIEKFAQNPSDMSVINFNRYKPAPYFWQWGRN